MIYKIYGIHARTGRNVQISTKQFKTLSAAEHFAKLLINPNEFKDLRFVNVEPEIEEHEIRFEISVGDFEHTFNRKPKDEDEFKQFAELCEKGLNAQIDWSMINECAKGEMGK